MDNLTKPVANTENMMGPMTENQYIINYMEQLTPLQMKAYEIAKDHLKTSFDITRSNGYNEWRSLQKNTNIPLPPPTK